MEDHSTKLFSDSNNIKTNNMSTERKKLNPAWLLALLLPAMLIFAAFQFLNGTQDFTTAGKTYSITGWQAVATVPHFWLLVWVGILIGFLILFIVYLDASGSWFARRWKPSNIRLVVLCALAILSMIIPWLRAGSIAVEGGIFAPKTQLYVPKTTTDIPVAAHWNSCSHNSDDLLSKR